MESCRNAEGRNTEWGSREGYNRLSLRKHGVSLSSHMWNSLSGLSEALMEINQSGITATFETDQHSPSLSFPFAPSLSYFFFFSKDILPLLTQTSLPLFLPIQASSLLPFTCYLTLVLSPLIINATPLIRSISPLLLHLYWEWESQTASNLF